MTSDNFKVELEALLQSLEKTVRANRMEALKRWGQADCETCGKPLETLFNQDGKHPIRICMPCELKAQANAEA